MPSSATTGHEWGYVLSGTLQVTVGFRQYLLEAGTRSRWSPPRRIGWRTWATRRSTPSGSSSAATPTTPPSARLPRSRSRRVTRGSEDALAAGPRVVGLLATAVLLALFGVTDVLSGPLRIRRSRSASPA